MKINIIGIREVGSSIIIAFMSAIGEGLGIWKSTQKPKNNYHYDVEFDLDCTLDGVASICNDQKCKIQAENDSVIISGLIELIEDDGMVYLRLAEDCLVMIESGSTRFEEGDWVELKLGASDLEISAIGT